MSDFKDRYIRNEGILGKEGIKILEKSKVVIIGIGGVGGYTCEALARAGIGSFVLVDGDVVEASNLNRQIIADVNSIGRDKVILMEERIHLINPEAKVETFKLRISDENINNLDFNCDFIVDAVDDINAKVLIIEKAKEKNKKIISAMGAANKVDPTAFKVGDIYETSVCPLAKRIRKELRKRDIDHLKVVYSTEKPIETGMLASLSFVPSVCGLIIAGEVIKDLTLRNFKDN